MIPARPLRHPAVGVSLVVLGLGIALFAGVQVFDLIGEQHTYSISEADRVRQYESLPEAEQDILAVSEEMSTERVSLNDTNASVPPLADTGPTIVDRGGIYHCLSLEHGASGTERVVVVDSGCTRLGPLNWSGPVVHEFSALSTAGQTVIRRALEDPDRRISIDGDTPPEFESGTDAPTLGTGRYYVEYEREYYRLTVTGESGLGAAILAPPLAALGLLGLSLVVGGMVILSRE